MNKPIAKGGLETLATRLEQLPANGVGIIAISGFCGSGKSTLAVRLQDRLDAVHVEADVFMTDRLARSSADWDTIDRARIARQVLEPARMGVQMLRYQLYNWDTNMADRWLEARVPRFILLEGIGILHPRLTPFYNFSVWVNRSQEESMQNALRRDHEERGHDHDELWHQYLIPNDTRYFDKYRPSENVDFIYLPDETPKP